MRSTDRGVTFALVILLAVLSVGVLIPSERPAAAVASPSPRPAPTPAELVYREGIVGAPSSVTPLTARSQADRDLVALVFSGLVRLGPDGTYLPDLASSWTVDAKGTTYTFTIRRDAAWQDFAPVTAQDVVFTVGLLKAPGASGPLVAGWAGVSVAAVDARTVRFTLAAPTAGFLEAATLPLLPEHLLQDVSAKELGTSEFSRHPVGSGPFRLVSFDAAEAVLEPTGAMPGVDGPGAVPSGAIPSGASPAASGQPLTGVARLALRFFADAAALDAAFRSGALDAAGGLDPADARALVTRVGVHVLRYPRTMLLTIVPNLRATHPEFRDPAVRRALLEAIDRTTILDDVLGGMGAVADQPVSPSSWAFDASAAGAVPCDTNAAVAALKKAGWTRKADGWHLPGSARPITIELATLDAASNPAAWGAAGVVAAAWRALGLGVSVVGFSPDALVTQRLQGGRFSVALLAVDLGLDPDLYPLLASTQAVTNGSNISGLQDPALDRLLVAARAPGSLGSRKAAFRALEAYLARAQPMLPLAFPDYLLVTAPRLSGPVPRELADPSERYWDVLDWRLAGGG